MKDIRQRELRMKNSRGTGCPILYALLKKLGESKHPKRYCGFYKNRKLINIKESQRMMSLGFDIPICPHE
jgi:hypothetical protein